MEWRKTKMICDHCFYGSVCKEIPDNNGRCSNYLKDGEISFSDDLKFNPSDTLAYDYDLIKRFMDIESPV